MAGILPYAKQVINNKKHIYFLFSRETLDNKKTNHKGMWSDFGGSKEKGETILETAIREGYEEMSGMLGSKTKLRNLVTKTDIKHVTKSNYHCNFMQISYNKQLPYYLENNYKFIKKTNPTLICSNGYFEKNNNQNNNKRTSTPTHLSRHSPPLLFTFFSASFTWSTTFWRSARSFFSSTARSCSSFASSSSICASRSLPSLIKAGGSSAGASSRATRDMIDNGIQP